MTRQANALLVIIVTFLLAYFTRWGYFAKLIAKITRFEGAIKFDAKKPDGTPRKLLDVSRAASMGWEATINLKAGIEQVYEWMLRDSSLP